MSPTNPAGREWDIRLDERVKRKPGRLVEVNRLATRSNADKTGVYSRLNRLPREATLFEDVNYAHVQSELNRLGQQRPDDLAALMYRVTLATGTAAPDQLAEIVRQVLRDFLLPVLPDAAAYLVEIDLALGRRYGLVRLLHQAQDDETMFLRPSAGRAGEPLFNSARWLFSDTSLGLDAYLAPLFLALAPWAWAAPAKRPGGVVIYTFGCLAAGRRSEASELLQLFFPEGMPQSGPKPQISPADIHAALNWWTEALDHLFTEVTDPAQYVGNDAQYSVKENFEALLSVEQVFRNVQSLSAQARDNHVRRTLLFDTLDMLEGLRKPDFAKMCELAYAQRVLDEVTSLLSPEAGRALLPHAKQAVAALQQLQNGFFAPSRLKGGGLRVLNKNGNGERVMSLEAAAGAYLRVLRNGGHAFGGRAAPADGILLMAHDGGIPIDLPDLAYLYLLHLLAHPQVLRRRATRGHAGGISL